MSPKADELGHLIGGLYSTGTGAQKCSDLQRRFCRSKRESGKMVRMRMEMEGFVFPSPLSRYMIWQYILGDITVMERVVRAGPRLLFHPDFIGILLPAGSNLSDQATLLSRLE